MRLFYTLRPRLGNIKKVVLLPSSDPGSKNVSKHTKTFFAETIFPVFTFGKHFLFLTCNDVGDRHVGPFSTKESH